jgi:hypothetical protein
MDGIAQKSMTHNLSSNIILNTISAMVGLPGRRGAYGKFSPEHAAAFAGKPSGAVFFKPALPALMKMPLQGDEESCRGHLLSKTEGFPAGQGGVHGSSRPA